MVTKFLSFFTPPVRDNIEESERARFLHFALFVVTGASIILGILNLPGKSDLGIFLLAIAALSLLGIPANKAGHYVPAALFISGLMLVLLTYSLLAGVGLKDAALIGYPIFIIFASYLFKRRAVWFATLLAIGSVILVYFLLQNGVVPPAHYSDESQLKALIVLFLAVGFLFWVVVDNWERVLKSLEEAYDLTLTGWGQALEIRDHETGGHSQRVVEMTLALAERMGIRRNQLDHIRRGVLLHDIGKMGVPDAILLKKGKLSEAEKVIVKQHPVYARNMLENIPFLKPAMDIPYCHHERWNGGGYPKGLSGEEIPLAARIFAVVDVWDALTTDRPYRTAWSHAKAREYIRAQSGVQFDPRVVEAFLKLVA